MTNTNASGISNPPDWAAAARWWHRLTDDKTEDRGAMARLRRANLPVQAWSESETMRLYEALGFGARDRDKWVEPVAILAILLANVRDNVSGSLGAALGSGDPPVLHPLRLRRLTAARDGAETLRGFREAVALLGSKAPVADLARCVLGWLDPEARDMTRTRLLFDYHGAGFAAPSNPDDQPGA